MLALAPMKFLRQIEYVTVDWRFQARAPSDPPADPRIAVVGIGDYSLEKLGRWPWARSVHGEFLGLLAATLPPKATVFDILFTEPSQDVAQDEALAAGLEKHPNAITGAGSAVTFDVEEGPEDRRPSQIGKTEPIPHVIGDIRALVGGEDGLLPIPRVAESAWTGFVDCPPDPVDGVRRRYPLVVRLGEGVYPSLGLQALLRLHDLRTEDVEVVLESAPGKADGGFVKIRGREGAIHLIPIDAHGRMWINFRGVGTFNAVDYGRTVQHLAGVLQGRPPPPDFPPIEDQIVLIGQVAEGLTDFGPTPHNPRTALVLVHANAINTILQSDYLRIVPAWPIWLGWLLLAWGTLWMLRKVPVALGVIVPLAVVAGYIALAFFLFKTGSLQVPLFLPIAGFLAVHGSAITDRLIAEIRAKSRIKGMFGTYVSPEVVDTIIASDEDPKLGGENCEITAFFSDIQGFSSFSELLTAEQLVTLLNEYLTPMTEILQITHGGTLDKYIGDAIVGIFGAPLHFPDHARRACLATVEMQARQAELREKWKRDGAWPEIVHRMQTRIGLNTGEAVIGNMGSPNRFNYTMMGDNVNLAARCESGAKAYGVYTMVTGETRDAAAAARDDIAFRYLDRIVVKGRTRPVEMHEVMGLTAEMSAAALDCVAAYTAGVEKYLARDWDAARAAFETSAALEPFQPGGFLRIQTNPSLVMIERAAAMKANPPGEDWDGVYVMTSK